MRAGIVSLVAAYVLSQFYRAFLAVLAPDLGRDIGATAGDLAAASGLWFVAFALMQLPVGWSLDRIGPRWTASVLLALGGAGGALWMARATGPDDIRIAMVMIGIGCAPVLMAAYYIFARQYAPAIFGTLAGAMVGLGSFGNIAASLPLAWVAGTLGWRGAMLAMAAASLAIAVLLAALVRDPPRVAGPAGGGSLLSILRLPALWLILPLMALCYVPAAALRGLWVGPYYAQVFGEGAEGIGRVTLVMGLAMVAGSFAYGPLERLTGSRKRVNLAGNALTAAALLALALLPPGWWTGVLLLAAVGFCGASFGMMIAHGRAFFPPHLVGRGVTFLNMCALGSVGIAQFATRWLFAAVPPDPPAAPFNAIFLALGTMLAVALVPYALSRDRAD